MYSEPHVLYNNNTRLTSQSLSRSKMLVHFVTLSFVLSSVLPLRRFGQPLVPPQVSGPLPDAQWFTQVLDHNNVRDLRTWKQRYWVSWEHFQAGGPALIMIGGEGEENPAWLRAGALAEYGEQYGAAMFILEHRYYGQSRPTQDLSVKNLTWLSSHQALADLAGFIEGMSAQHNITGPWVAIGGSYPGSLAGWLRLKYPHLVAGSVATSGPVFAKPDFHEYLEVVETALKAESESCSTAVSTALAKIEFLTAHRVGWSMLTKMFNLCKPFTGLDKADTATLVETLIGNIETIVQYNKDRKEFEGGKWGNITTRIICNIMEDRKAGSELQQFAQVNSLSLKMADTECLDVDYNNKVAMLRNTKFEDPSSRVPGDVGNRPWFYQTCTEFGWYQSSSQKGHPFGATFPVEFFVKMCSDVFGPKFNTDMLSRGIDITNREYGSLNISVTNVVFVHGSLDPWHALGVTTDLSSDAPAILIDGTSHCSNLYPSSPDDSQALKDARKRIGELIGLWVKGN